MSERFPLFRLVRGYAPRAADFRALSVRLPALLDYAAQGHSPDLAWTAPDLMRGLHFILSELLNGKPLWPRLGSSLTPSARVIRVTAQLHAVERELRKLAANPSRVPQPLPADDLSDI